MTLDPPKVDDAHLVADFIELSCLRAGDGVFSASDAEAERVREEELDPSLIGGAADEDDLVRMALGIGAEDPEGGALRVLGGDADDPLSARAPLSTPSGEESTDALSSDNRAVLTQDVIEHLLFRARVFGGVYPFKVDVTTGSLECRKLTRRRRAYVLLLTASSLSSFNKRDQATLTRSFERLSVPVMRAHTPGAHVHLFGTSGVGVRGRYRGLLADKVERLASDLRIVCIADKSKIKPTNTGDQGIDAVVWFETQDDSTGLLAVFVQCACSYQEWPRKMLDVVEEAFKYWFHFFSPVVNLVMIPFCYRDASGAWFDTTRMKGGVLFDRIRILLALNSSAGSWSAVDQLLPSSLFARVFPSRSFRTDSA